MRTLTKTEGQGQTRQVTEQLNRPLFSGKGGCFDFGFAPRFYASRVPYSSPGLGRVGVLTLVLPERPRISNPDSCED
jgi:hypothetical protein